MKYYLSSREIRRNLVLEAFSLGVEKAFSSAKLICRFFIQNTPKVFDWRNLHIRFPTRG